MGEDPFGHAEPTPGQPGLNLVRPRADPLPVRDAPGGKWTGWLARLQDMGHEQDEFEDF
jgi:hypothetical protein